MQLQTTTTAISDWSGDLLAIAVFQTEDTLILTDPYTTLDQRLNGLLQDLITEGEFQGKSGTSLLMRLLPNFPIKKLLLVGLGNRDEFNLETLRRTAATIARTARREKAKTVAMALPHETLDAADVAQAIAEGTLLALHSDVRFKSDPEARKLLPYPESVTLLGLGEQAAALNRAQQICDGVILARELVNAPANQVTPVTLAETAQQLAATYGLSAKILEREECAALGMGAFLGVAQASDLPPKFIHLTYTPGGTVQKKIALVGKGLTFDSGGLNLKTQGGIETMKMDMGGAAAVLGTAKVIGQLKPPGIEVHFIIAATENMISGRAMHPGDILTAANGKTIEVNNTDAEGRLTLADALVYAEKLGVDAIVDLATLTGACIVALGDNIAGLWSNNSELAQALQQAGDRSGEKFWQMPLENKYFEGMKSQVADMKNTGPRSAGSITAALFLQQFVDHTPWAHLDIAGPVWTEKEDGYNNPCGTGYPVRTLVEWLCSLSA
ncbi:leucyl aminopeptidase [uncultured Thermosynechococcus sp.]|uniref:leucyl aminopeptidase n=2 Tax=uncultured Thermosynechococcus sp. TaxID=436945 RepID=UPI0026201840|nr:leucyl aminopeptidase [uncultured Thermosynechococcus sp.]